jgi:tRNA(Ile)-lysidine synthase
MLADTDDSLLRDIAFAEYSDHITISEEEERAVIDLEGLSENPPSVNSRIVSLVMELLGLESSATYENVSAVMDLMYSEHPSAGIDLPMGIRAYREYDRLVFSGREEVLTADESIALYPKVMPAREFDPDEEEAYAAFDFDKFNAEHPGRIGDIVLRTRREGDYLPMKSGSKKIQDLLVDSKVRKSARESILMAAIGSEILWVLPSGEFSGERERLKGRFSQKYQISDTTERVLLIELGETM